jgi:hypothetical protein
VCSACDRESEATLVSHLMADQNLLSRAPPCFERHVKQFISVAFAIHTGNPTICIHRMHYIKQLKKLMELIEIWIYIYVIKVYNELLID